MNFFIKNTFFCVFFVLVSGLIASCKKLIEIPPPEKTITTQEVFSDSADAAAAITGIYSRIVYGLSGQDDVSFCNGSLTVFCGMSADELVLVNRSNPLYLDFYLNTLKSNNQLVYSYFWLQAYSSIYQANASIEALQASTGLSTSVKNQFMGEAKFLRAMFYFYLVNLFGDVPNIRTSAWANAGTRIVAKKKTSETSLRFRVK